MAARILVNPRRSLGTTLKYLLQCAAVKSCQSVSWDTFLSGEHRAPRLLQIDTCQAYPLTYRSSLALTLARSGGNSPQHLAEAIRRGLVALTPPHLSELDQALELSIVEPSIDWLLPYIAVSMESADPCKERKGGGEWIDVSISAAGVARWLEQQLWTPGLGSSPLRASNDLGSGEIGFSVVHAYARCCTILRLARENGLVSQSDTRQRLSTGSIGKKVGNAARSIPWLRGDRLWSRGEIRQALLLNLIRSLDRSAEAEIAHRSRTRHARALRRVYNQGLVEVSNAFYAFHAVSRPLVQTCSENIDPIDAASDLSLDRLNAQADLGLMAVTQRVLAQLFCGLGLVPPVTL
ncbi:MAG: hypothetical protein WBA10_15575 [Elainellaceae cyanobacterium]